jgi:hypothetical protein
LALAEGKQSIGQSLLNRCVMDEDYK